MTDTVTIVKTITGAEFPAEDVDLIADYYGGSEEEDKLAFVSDMAEAVMVDALVNFLNAPAQSYLQNQSSTALQTEMAALSQRTKDKITVVNS
jgi:hypothetical protein